MRAHHRRVEALASGQAKAGTPGEAAQGLTGSSLRSRLRRGCGQPARFDPRARRSESPQRFAHNRALPLRLPRSLPALIFGTSEGLYAANRMR